MCFMLQRKETYDQRANNNTLRRNKNKTDGGGDKKKPSPPPVCQFQTLNLAHNSFSVVPKSLSCLAPLLTRLNISYNSLTRMGSPSTYPAGIKHLVRG